MNFSKNYAYELRCRNCLCISKSIPRILELSPLPILLLKYRIKYLTKSEKHAPLQFLKVKLKNGFQRVALVNSAKRKWDKWVLHN